MCDNCFDRLIYKFEEQTTFEKFETVIQNKCLTGQLEIIDRRLENHFLTGLEPYMFYKCKTCGTIWTLSIPENAWRGYFLTQDKAIEYQKEIDKKQRKGQIGCIVLLVVIAVTIIWFFVT